MDSCERFRQLISDKIDGELRGRALQELEEHLKKCRDCMKLLERMQSLRSEMRRLTSIRTSPDFDAVLRARIRLAGRERRHGYGTRATIVPWRIPAIGFAVILLAIVSIASITMLSHRQSDNLAQSPRTSSPTGIEGTRSAQDSVDVMVNYVLESIPIEDFLSGKGVPLASEAVGSGRRPAADSVNLEAEPNMPPSRHASSKRLVSF